jgi:BspA type Leucine rich repeat region (6 copies)
MKTKAEFKNGSWMQFKQHLTVWAGGLLLLTLPAVVQAQFNYVTNNGTITITGYYGPGGAVTIPSTINGLPVTSIGSSAFYHCTSLTSVTIPNSVTSIGGDGFFACTSLASVAIGNGVTNIEYEAFAGCTSLRAFTVDALNHFYSSLAGVLFDKNGTTLIQYPAGKAGTSYTIPNSVTKVGDWAFYLSKLTSITIPNSVTSIGVRAFYNCYLTSAIIPDSVTSIQTETFFFCGGLTNVTIGNSVTNIGMSAFGVCIRMTSVTIPNSVISIETGAFSTCTSLTSVTIPNSVTGIGNSAFGGCTNLTGIYFKGNAPSLGGSYVFASDSNATVYYLPGTTGWDATFGGRPTALWDPPTLQRSPHTQTAEAGSAVCLWAHATNSLPLFYLWYLNSTNLISCSTNCELELTNLQFSQSGAYTVVISNALGAVTSPPAMLNVIAAVERRLVPGVKVTGETGSSLNVDYASSLSPAPDWTTLGSVGLTSTSQYYFDLTAPLPPQRFYRAWQTGTPSVVPSLNLNFVPAITLTGNVGDSLRLDYINAIGPTDAWVTLDTVTLTNTSQLYFDVSAPGQPRRLYRLIQLP